MAAAMVRQHSGQRFRSGRFRGRHGSGEENIHLDFSKEPQENVKEILTYVVKQQAFSKAKKLGYLNVFVKLLNQCGDNKSLGIPLRHILICLSVNLLQSPKEVRAGTLRVIRHLIRDEESLQELLHLHIDYYIARSLDLCLDNEVERIHAQKLVRKIAAVIPKTMPKSLVYPLVAIGNDGVNERDRMVRASLACICELTYSNPDLVAHCGGVSMVLRKILDCHQYPRINESLVATILHLVNHPRTRHFIRFNTDLEQLIAPFTDCHFSYSGETTDQSSDDRESRFAASRMAVITVMRSWPGIIRFCRPDGTGLQSLIGILYLPFSDVRQALLELVLELFQLTVPEWTADFTEALLSIDPSKLREDWRLTDGFVANEGKALLPNMARVRPNLVDNHMALLLSAWINAGILDALVEVIITTENELFVRAVILLGELLHMANVLLPPECSSHSHYLPSLMALASSFDIPNTQRHQASLAISHLNRMHALKKRGPIPCSLYLDQIVKQSDSYKERPVALSIQKNKILDVYVRKRASSSEEVGLQNVKDTQVLGTKENKNWDWDLIEYILKWPDDKMKKLEDQIHIRFIKRIVFFFKPTNHLFSRMEGDHPREKQFAIVGLQLVDFLVRYEQLQEENAKQLTDLLADISLCLSEVASQRIAPESVLSASNVINTLSHYYFLLLGRISMSSKGDRYIEKAGIYQHLLEIVTSAQQDSYVKLITSSLYYGREGNSRAVLSKALCAGTESGRLYSTKVLRVFLRAKVQNFTQWGIELLTTQLYDKSRSVAMTALAVLDEACELKENLESLVSMKPSFLHLGEKGVMILCRYMSTATGFKFLTEANYTMNELKKWHSYFNTRYVMIVEEMLNEALTTYEKTYEGSYTRRSSYRRQKKDVLVPIHLYGQLVQHKDSFQLLRQQTYIEDYFQCIRCQELKSDDDLLQLKTALWAVGHISMSSWGSQWLQEEGIVPEFIRLAEESAVYSIRGTAFFILGMIASTREGAVLLSQYGWESRWNTRAERWPLTEDRTLLLEDSMEDLRSGEAAFSIGSSKFELGSPVSNLDFIAEEAFQLGKPGKARNIRPEKCDSESGIHIPDLQPSGGHSDSPELRRHGARMKSQTLPFDSQSYRRYEMLPVRSHTFRSVAISKDKTRSVECLSKGRDMNRISKEKRSQSLRWEMASKQSSDSSKPMSVISSLALESKQDSHSDDSRTYDSNQNRISQDISRRDDQELTKDDDDDDEDSDNDDNDDDDSDNDSDSDTDTVLTLAIDRKTDSANKQESTSSETSTSITPNQETRKESAGECIEIKVTDTDVEPVDSSNSNLEALDDVDGATTDSVDGVDGGNVKPDTNDQGFDHVHVEERPALQDAPQREHGKTLVRLDSKDSVKKSGAGLKEERSSSSESSRTSKSRTDSFNTDSVTSGIGSYDSGHHGVIEHPSLSPIASNSSLDHIEVQMRTKENKTDPRDLLHHSTALRRQSNLSRVPSLRRQSARPSISLMSTSKVFDFSESAIMYTTARDAMGYATLRALMKNRTISSDVESEYGLSHLYDNMGSVTSLNRRPSIDSSDVSVRRPQSILRNFSGLSLSEMDSPGGGAAQPQKMSLYQQRPHTGEAEFMGVAIPVDINMMFEVHEGEDKRCQSFLGSGVSRQASMIDPAYAAELASEQGKGARSRATSASSVSEFIPQPMSSEHNTAVCLQCWLARKASIVSQTIDEKEIAGDKTEGEASRTLKSSSSHRAHDSTTDGQSASSGSLTGSTPDSSSSRKLSLDTPLGRTLLRKEIIRFVINLSSSVGVKGAEQGLLSLKQKFPKAFQDLCFFSEVSYLLGTCSFRLNARRFIQELFEDIDISKILDEARDILGIDMSLDNVVIDKSVPEGFDDFEEFS